jgi:hypothetical protein
MRVAIEQEQCPDCLQLYAYELEIRCFDCDSPLCPFCVFRIDVDWFCLGCKESRYARPGDVES